MCALNEKKLFLLDMDGTIYLDDTLFESVHEFLFYIKSTGGRYVFLTNNSSRGVDSYIKKLSVMGVGASEYDFFTSTDTAIDFFIHSYSPKKKIYVMGTSSFYSQLKNSGMNVTRELDDDVATLLLGFDTELTYKKLEDACILLSRGAEYFATHPDLVCPTSYGFVPDCGSVAQMLYNATGRTPRVFGKPQPEIAYAAMERTGFSAAQTILIGDRLYTDIACGVNAGIKTVLVLSGETKLDDVLGSDIKPDYIFKDVAALYSALLLDEQKRS